ncbi:hypothetical protein T4D_8837 [Trichinella pseudospiralis]|uniref:Uncharacterized protein n=1 Tax=Trichinella pseudospiralis TaxID=6337 RepID=A0A0V1G5U2_TRIPS|nr:hypothetical protein T4D_8837 [Trichinella pseudospiralis]
MTSPYSPQSEIPRNLVLNVLCCLKMFNYDFLQNLLRFQNRKKILRKEISEYLACIFIIK